MKKVYIKKVKEPKVTTPQYKKEIDTFFNLKYKRIEECAINILRTIQQEELYPNLITQTYQYLLDTEKSISKKITDEETKNKTIESIVVRYMTMQVRWMNTPFRNENIYKKLKTVEIYDKTEIIREDEEDYLEKEKEIQDKMAHIIHTISNLPIHYQLLYNDYFHGENNTMDKLAKHYKLSRSSCFNLITEIKDIIKNTYKKTII